MQGTVSARTRSRIQIRRTRFRYTPLMVSTSAFWSESMALVDIVTDLHINLCWSSVENSSVGLKFRGPEHRWTLATELRVKAG